MKLNSLLLCFMTQEFCFPTRDQVWNLFCERSTNFFVSLPVVPHHKPKVSNATHCFTNDNQAI